MGVGECRVSVLVAEVGIVGEGGAGSFLLGETLRLQMDFLRLVIQRKLVEIGCR